VDEPDVLSRAHERWATHGSDVRNVAWPPPQGHDTSEWFVAQVLAAQNMSHAPLASADRSDVTRVDLLARRPDVEVSLDDDGRHAAG
jgi:hypothetical protein